LDFGTTSSITTPDLKCQATSGTLTGCPERGYLLAGGHMTERTAQLSLLSPVLKTEPRVADSGCAKSSERNNPSSQKDSRVAPSQRVTASTSTGQDMIAA